MITWTNPKKGFKSLKVIVGYEKRPELGAAEPVAYATITFVDNEGNGSLVSETGSLKKMLSTILEQLDKVETLKITVTY